MELLAFASKSLRRLDIAFYPFDSGITARDLTACELLHEVVRRSPYLEELTLSDVKHGPCLDAVSKLSRLKKFKLSTSKNVGDALRLCGNMESLQELTLPFFDTDQKN